MVLAEKENMPGALPLQGKNVELQQKEHLLNVSSSKIPVLCRSRLSPGQKQAQQVCSNTVKSKELKMSKVSSLSVPVLTTAAGLFSKSSSREPLVEMQLSTSGHRNELEDGNANSKEARAVEFVPDPEALVSILSNTGLSNRVMSTTHKPSLARRVLLRGNRASSANSGTGQVSLYVGATAADPSRTPHLSGLASKVGRSLSCGLSLNAQQLRTLSMALGNLAPGVEATPNQPMENLQAGKCKGSAAGPKTACPSSIADAGEVKQSNSAGSKEATGTSWAGEEFVPDPAAKASILLNVGLSHSALGTGSKLSLARRVPLKDVRKACPTSGSLRE
uniref:Uncharacterized protein n=1 Tax=Sphaerodactylus townsendi TaxID=933632 RepID=A0ACB8EN76_9SAUR